MNSVLHGFNAVAELKVAVLVHGHGGVTKVLHGFNAVAELKGRLGEGFGLRHG